VIRGFADKEAEKLFQRRFSRKIPAQIQRAARRRLEILDGAEGCRICAFAGERLEKLAGDRTVNTVSVSTSSGVSALSGKTEMRMRSRSLIITDQRQI